VILVAVWVSRTYVDQLGHSPLVQRLLEALGGQSLAAARGYVQSLAQFAESPADAVRGA
jgi:hypothetical protein